MAGEPGALADYASLPSIIKIFAWPTQYHPFLGPKNDSEKPYLWAAVEGDLMVFTIASIFGGKLIGCLPLLTGLDRQLSYFDTYLTLRYLIRGVQ